MALKQNFAKSILNSKPGDLKQTLVSAILIGLYMTSKQNFAIPVLKSTQLILEQTLASAMLSIYL